MEVGSQLLDHRDRRGAILDAALRCFNRKGVSATTVDDVRQGSGASVGSIYHHFGGKEQLAGALYLEGLRSYQRGLAAVLRRHTDAEAGVRAIVRHHLRWVERNPELARFLLSRGETAVELTADDQVKELNRAFFSETAAWLRPHVEAGLIRELPLDLYYAVVIGPSQEFVRHWLHGRASSSIRQAEGVLAEAAWDALAVKGG
jgi:AcrR family transcriptional regulator